jgi:hypothetical protein
MKKASCVTYVHRPMDCCIGGLREPTIRYRRSDVFRPRNTRRAVLQPFEAIFVDDSKRSQLSVASQRSRYCLLTK